jgi:CRP-like cAMP-binding protein
MHHSTQHTASELSLLAQAIAANQADDAMAPLTDVQWAALNGYLQPLTLAPGQILIDQGSTDRGVYWVESGSLSVHYEDEKGRLRMALVGAGGLLGEGAFFSHRPRTATVQAGSVCRLWGLTPLRFTELSNRQPAIALALSLAMGGVLAKRLANRRRRVAAT